MFIFFYRFVRSLIPLDTAAAITNQSQKGDTQTPTARFTEETDLPFETRDERGGLALVPPPFCQLLGYFVHKP